MDTPSNPTRKRAIAVAAGGGRPVVARIWRGRTRAEDADAYLDYVQRNGVLEIERKPGNLGVQLFRRVGDGVAEFTTISYWESLDAMAAMHDDGGDVLRVAHLDKDPEYLLELPEFVEIAELHANLWRPAGAS